MVVNYIVNIEIKLMFFLCFEFDVQK